MLIEIQGNVIVCAHINCISKVRVFKPDLKANDWSPIYKDWLVPEEAWRKQAYAYFSIGLIGGQTISVNCFCSDLPSLFLFKRSVLDGLSKQERQRLLELAEGEANRLIASLVDKMQSFLEDERYAVIE